MISPVQFNHLITIKMNSVQNKTSFKKAVGKWMHLEQIFFSFAFKHANSSQSSVYFTDKYTNFKFRVLIALSIFRTGLCKKYIWGPLLVFHLSLESGYV